MPRFIVVGHKQNDDDGDDDTDDDDADEHDVVGEDNGNANDDGNVNATGNDLCCMSHRQSSNSASTIDTAVDLGTAVVLRPRHSIDN